MCVADSKAMLIFASNLNAMTQLTADNSNKQAISLTEFVDSVFVELHNKRKTEENGVEYPNCWKDTLIPLFAKIHEISQSDASVFWWLIQTMSRMDIFQDPRDFITRHVYDVLSTIKPSQSKIVLEHIEGISEQDVKLLHDLLCNNNLDDFRKLFRANNYSSIFDVCRVLMRLQNVHILFSKAASKGKEDSLAILFYFFQQCKNYFLNAYERYGRSCDGMMYNIFLALDNTQYYVDNELFCRLSKEIGDFLKQYIFFIHLTCQDMPNGVDQVICNVLNGTGEYDGLSSRYKDCDINDQKILFFEEKIAFLKPNDSKLLYQLMKENRQKITSPFWHLTVQKKKRKRISGRSSQDGSSPSIESSYYQLTKDDSIPVEKLSDISLNKLLISFIEDEGNGSRNGGNGLKNNEEIRETISTLIPAISLYKKNKYTEQTFIDFFDAILINPLKDKTEEADRDRIVSELLSHKGSFLFNRIKANVFCLIIGHLIRKDFLCDKPNDIAKELMPHLIFPKEKNEDVVCDTIRSYIQNAKKKKGKDDDRVPMPPGIQLIDSVLKRLK